MLNELHLRKRGNPDEIFQSYYGDVLEVAKKKSIKYDAKEKPLMPHTYYFDEGDRIIFCVVSDERKIFHKPIQVAIGKYFESDLVDWMKVEEILFQENYEMNATIQIPAGTRKVSPGDEVPLVRSGMVVKGVINNGMLHLLWDADVNSKIIGWFYREEQSEQIKKQAKVELDFDLDKKDKKDDDDDIDFLNPDTSPEMKITMTNSREDYNKWFNKKFPHKPNLTLSPLMENYVRILTKHNKYYY